jgi:hypothetical protein
MSPCYRRLRWWLEDQPQTYVLAVSGQEEVGVVARESVSALARSRGTHNVQSPGC